MKISKPILESYLVKAIELLEDSGVPRYKIREKLGLTYVDLSDIELGDIEVVLADDERYKIACEVDREDKLNDIITRVKELDEDESPCLNGFSATEIIEDESLLDEILRRYEKAEGWVDNSDYWYLIDDCIKDVMKIERSMKK